MKKTLLISLLAVLALCGCQKEPEPIKVTAVTLNVTSLNLIEGETGTITATVSPRNADNQKILWTTNHPDIATVSNGIVTAVKEGTAIITATSDDGGKTATCSITVNSKTVEVESVSLDKTEATLEVGETITLTTTVSPDNATDKTVTWSSSDEDVATVKEGVVSAIKAGSAIITAKAGDKTATCAVTVKAEETKNPFTITSIGSTSVFIAKVGNPDDITLKYRKGSGSWRSYTIGSDVSLADGEFVQFIAGEGGNSNFSKNGDNYYKVVVLGSGTVKVSGNIMSLLDMTGERATMPEYGFLCLFKGCNNMVDASKLELSATTLEGDCYSCMFWGCSSLLAAPELPATTLKYYCYGSMFSGCTSLQAAPDLPATNLATSCYQAMFRDCSSLHVAPELPATVLINYCYEEMFSGCSSLTKAPELPATTLTDYCYNGMFYGCSSLTKAPELPATTLTKSCYNGMFYGCSSLTKAPELPATNLASVCYEGMFKGCTSLQTAPDLPATTLAKSCYGSMFYGCTSLLTPPKLHATVLTDYCYNAMFYGCTSLLTAPKLPATTLAEGCYSLMLYGCTSLETAPDLPAITLATGCYDNMFTGCTSLVISPELPATVLAERCYYCMFADCTSLQTAPELPATTLEDDCYGHMFNNCSKLNYVKALFETTPSDTYTGYWLDGVSSTGTFVKSKDATWDVRGVNGIPEGWTVEIAE